MSSFGDDEFSTEMGYMTGKVISKEYSSKHSNWTFGLECPTGVNYTSKIYGADLGTGVAEPNVGDTIVGYGYFEKYVSSESGAVCYELAYHVTSKTSPIIISVTPAPGSETPDTPSNPGTGTTTPSDNHGTSTSPISITEARALTEKLEESSYNNYHYSTEIMYLTGTVSLIEPNGTYYNVTLTDGTNTFDIYKGNIGSGVTLPVAGDTVVASGYYCNYDGAYQLGYNNKVAATILSTSHNNYPVSYTILDGNDQAAPTLATVAGLSETAASGSTLEFTVTPATGYKISTVTVNNSAIEPNQSTGKYSFVATSSNVVKVSVLEENATPPVTEALAIKATAGTLNGNSISWSGEGFTFTNNKANSTTNIRTSDSDCFRAYKNSEIVISLTEGTQIKEIQITCTGGAEYTDPLQAAVENAGYNASRNGSVYTITGITGNTATIALTTGQIRLNKISVTYVA